MRDETYYYADQTSSNQSKEIKFVARELVKQVIESGYMIEGICNLPSYVLVMDVLLRRKLLSQDLWMQWKDEIFADKCKVKELEKSGQPISYHFGFSDAFKKSPRYGYWLNSIYPKIKTENCYGAEGEEKQGEQRPYLVTDRSGKVFMLEYFRNEMDIPFTNISPDDKEVYELLSDSVKFEGHPYLPDDPAFDLGIWGYPGIGTKRCVQALKERGRIGNFKELVEATRTALSFTAIEDECGNCARRKVPITEAVLEALLAYYMAWCYLHDCVAWKKAYQRAYLNPIYQKEWETGNWDGDLLIEKSSKKYWEKILMLEKTDRDQTDYYKDYLTPFPKDIDTVVQFMEQIAIKEGTLAIEEYGLLVLQGTYFDFWKWIYEEQAFQKDEVLIQIACYAENDEVRENKQKLLETVGKNDEYTFSNLVKPVSFHADKPLFRYGQRRRMVARTVEIEKNRYFKELQKFSHSFTKFSIETESATLFLQSSKKECQRYLREIDTYDLCRAFILYNPTQRDWIMESISLRLRNMLLEDMKCYVRSKEFSLDACVQSEHKITDIIKTIKVKTI